MERIQQLISKLKEQYEQQAPAQQLLATVQLLHAELLHAQQAPRTLGTSKVSVMMPPNMTYETFQKYAPQPAASAGDEPSIQLAENGRLADNGRAAEPLVETVLVDDGNLSIVQENGQLDMVFDPMLEIPTLSQHVAVNGATVESLNDKLKQGKTEVLEFLKDAPVKDLRKAIGINDRFSFINDLFRGDEAMYERSIKTINGFSIFPEAEYWITRELKTKLGWNLESNTVAQFDQLVRRRFS